MLTNGMANRIPKMALPQKKSKEIMEKDESEEAVKEDLQKNGEFYKGFNDWLAEIRIKSVRASQ